ncbi:MAG: hypothetical protein WAW13_04800 [Minisyncoccia bacterium]
MKILIATPLYPPDIAEPAPYVKELATRLKNEHEVTILAYNHIPEKIPGVRIVVVEKNRPLVIRLFHYIYSLYKEAKVSDCVYVQNGPSTEFPLTLVAPFVRTPFILRLGDETALSYASREKFHKVLLRWAIHFSHRTITHRESSTYTMLLTPLTAQENIHNIKRPHPRPEILPFTEFPKEVMGAYEDSWEAHVRELTHIFTI